MNLKLKLKLIITAVLFALMLTSCSSEAILSYGDHSISENEFIYYLATYKASFAQTYSDFEDTEEFFSQVVDDEGNTAEQLLYDSIVQNVKMTLVAEELFDKYGLSLSRSVEDEINAYLDDFIYEYSGGSKSKFNSALSEYGINLRILKQIYLRDEKTALLFDALYGSGGIIGITDENRQDYLDENYVRVRHIYVNNAYTYALDEDGMQEYNSDGTRKTRSLTEEELEAKQALIDAIDQSISDGGDFEEIYAAFSEDQYYVNGYYISRNMDFIDEVTEAAYELEVGERIKLESDYGVHYIMRLEMNEKPWEDTANADFFDSYDTVVAESLYISLIESYTEYVVVDEEALARYTVEASPTNYRF